MKKLLFIVCLLPVVCFSQEVGKDTIYFTEIILEEVDGHSAFLSYKNSKKDENYDLVFRSEDIYVNNKLLFDFDIGLCLKFDEEYAKELLGKPILLDFTMEEAKYFGLRKYVDKLTVLTDVEPVLVEVEEPSKPINLPFSYYCKFGLPNGSSDFNENGVVGKCEFGKSGRIIKFTGKGGELKGKIFVSYYYDSEEYDNYEGTISIQENKGDPCKEFRVSEYYSNGQLGHVHWSYALENEQAKVKDGKWIIYFKDGTIYEKGQYLNGTKSGEWITYHSKSGKKARVMFYEKGRLINNKTQYFK